MVINTINSSTYGTQFSVQDDNRNNLLVNVGNISQEDISVVRGSLMDAMNDPIFIKGNASARQEYLQAVANTLTSTPPQRIETDPVYEEIIGNVQNTYGDKYDYRKNLEKNNISAVALDQPEIADVGPIAEIKSSTLRNKAPGIKDIDRTTVIDGSDVNPFANINPNKYGPPEQHEIIGGADLCVFFLMEVPNVEDLNLPIEIQRKEILTIEVDNALSLSYSTTRERFPVRVLGNSNPVGMTRGPRTISGHIAFAIFVEDILSNLRSRFANEVAKIESSFREYQAETLQAQTRSNQSYNDWIIEKRYYNKTFLSLQNKVQLLDDLPPFHILCMGANENGMFSKFMIKNVHIIDENQYQGTQQPNIINKVTWVAEDIIPMHKVENWNKRSTFASSMNSSHDSFSRGKYSGSVKYNYTVTGSSLLDEIANDLRKG